MCIGVSAIATAMLADKHECPQPKDQKISLQSGAHPKRLVHLFSASLALSILFVCLSHLRLRVSLTYVYNLYFGGFFPSSFLSQNVDLENILRKLKINVKI